MNLLNLFRRGVNDVNIPLDALQQRGLHEAMQNAYVTETVSPVLQERVAALAMQHNQKRVMSPRRLSYYLLRFAACAACAFMICIVAAWPHIRTAYLLYRMQSAILNARSVHNVTFRMAHDPQAQEIWTDGKLWRVTTFNPYHDELYTDGMLQPDNEKPGATHAHTPVRLASSVRLASYQWVSGIYLSEMPMNAALRSLYSNLEKMSEYDDHGRHYIRYGWRLNIYDEPHTYLTMDATTGLPFSIHVEGQRHGVWAWSQTSLFEFNKPMEFYKHGLR